MYYIGILERSFEPQGDLIFLKILHDKPIESVKLFIPTINMNMQFISFLSTAHHLSVPVQKTLINDYYYYMPILYCIVLFVCIYFIA